MPTPRLALEAIHVLALALWLGFLVASGAVAAVIFPLMRELDPTLSGFTGYTGEHWRIAAGQIAARIFFISDVVQFAAIFFTVTSLVLSCWVFGLPLRRVSTMVRACALGGAALLAGYQLMVLGPTMNATSRDYWEAARAGDLENATRHRERFASMHPEATTALAGTALFVTVTLIAGVCSLAAGTDTGRGGLSGSSRARGEEALQPPALLR